MKSVSDKARIFFPNLDALRFLCFISVFFFHSFATTYQGILTSPTYHFIKKGLFGNGNLGVNFFFVLSGFLITYLLIVEKDRSGHIDIRKFYLRRILRIWPLFYFCVVFGFIFFPLLKSHLGGGISTETATPVFYLLFINNFDLIKNGAPDSSVLSILWSVAIEEQFYLFWPLVIGLISTKHLPFVFSGLIVSSFVFRLLHASNVMVLENHTLSCISDLTVGALGAHFIIYSKSFKNKIELLSPLIISGIYIASIICFLFRKEIFHHNPALVSADRLIISVLFLFIILEQNFSNKSFFKLHVLKRVSRLGQYTYGLYCLHMIGILIAATLLKKTGWNKAIWQVLILEGGFSLIITIGIAYLSYHFYENRFLKIKDRFAVVKTAPIVKEPAYKEDIVR